MKKLLSLIGLVGLTVPSVITVVSCNQQTAEEKLFNQKLAVFKTVQSIVEEGITFNDEFLLNYDLGLNGTEEQKAAFVQLVNDEFNANTRGIFSKLLAKIIYEKLLENIPDLRQQFPDFSLVVYLTNWGTDEMPISTEISQIVAGEKAEIKYKVGLNFSSYDLVETIDYGNKNRNQDVNKDEPFWSSLADQTREFLVDGSLSQKLNHEQPTFIFKQTNMINDYNEWMNYYLNLYNNFSFGKALKGDYDNFHSFSKFWIFWLDYLDKEYELGLNRYENIVKTIIESNDESIILEKIDFLIEYITNLINTSTGFNFKTYKDLNLFDNFSIEKLEFKLAYTVEQILLDKSLKRSFNPYFLPASLDEYSGIMMFDITLKFSNVGYKDRFYQERIYLAESTRKQV